MIKVLQRRQIDDEMWNAVIKGSAFENIYPYTWYLDACADSWLAFVMNDYECIMPVVFRKKLTIKYAYQPAYCQQLGVFSEKRVDSEIVRMFLHRFGSVFKLGDYAFNAGNVTGDEKGFEESDNTNYVLDLAHSYDHIYKNYNENCRRNIKKAGQNKLTFTDDISLSEMISLKKMSEGSSRSDKHYLHQKQLFSRLEEIGKIKILGVKMDDHLIAAAVFGFSNNRAVFLLSASSDAGKEKRAMFKVVDTFIQMHSGIKLKLDFEGSNIVSIARFFRGFGAKPEIYQRVSITNSAGNILKKLKGV